MEIPPWVKGSLARARTDAGGTRLLVRAGPEHAWATVALFRRARSYLPADDGVFVCWIGPVDERDEDLPVERDTPVVTYYGYDGALRWTLGASELPFFGREGARLGGLPYCSSIDGVVHIRSGPWFCVVRDADGPILGPAEHTRPPDPR